MRSTDYIPSRAEAALGRFWLAAAVTLAAISAAWGIARVAGGDAGGPRRTVLWRDASYGNQRDVPAGGVDLGFLKAMPEAAARNFQAAWRAVLDVGAGGAYVVQLHADDDAGVTIDGEPVVVHGNGSPGWAARRTLELAAGLHPIEVRYAQGEGGAVLDLRLGPTGAPPQPPATADLYPPGFEAERLPRARLMRHAGGWIGAAWLGLALAGAALLVAAAARGATYAARLPSWLTAIAYAAGLTPWLATIAYAALLARWFGGGGSFAEAGRMAPRVLHLTVLLVLLCAGAALAHRRRLAALGAELAAALSMERGVAAGLAVVLLISFAFQLPTMLYPSGLVHSDAAINGLMGLHIAAGRAAPAFYYGQQFMGTLFSHVLALLFVAAGPFTAGPFTAGLALLTWAFYAGFLLATFWMVRQAAGAVVALAVTAWLAVPPTTLVIVLAQSEYPQLLLLAGWGLLLVAARSGGVLRDDAWWGLAGVAFGLAFWAHALAVVPVAAALASAVLLLPWRALARAASRLAAGFAIGVLPAVIGWGGGLGGFVEWFLAGGGRGGDAGPARAAAGLARVSLGNLLLDTAGRQVLSWWIAAPLAAIVLGTAAWAVAAGVARRAGGLVAAEQEWGSAAEPKGQSTTSAKRSARHHRRTGARRLAVALPLGLLVLFELGLVALRHGYQVTPIQYLVPLYLALPALIAIAAAAAVEHTGWAGRRGGGGVAALMLLWACIPLPASLTWLRGLAADQASWNASIDELHAAGVETCEAPYWDAYRVSYLTLETIVCESIDVRRVPHYPELVAQRADGAELPFIAAPQRRAALQERAAEWEARGVPYRRLETPRLIALLPRR